MFLTQPIKAGATNQSIYLQAKDASTGLPYLTAAYDDAGIALGYIRNGADTVAITPATQTAAGAHSDGGFVHIGGGICRLDVPDAAFVAGVSDVIIHGSATAWNLEPINIPFDRLSQAMTESYAANEAVPSLEQAVLAIHQRLFSFTISSTSLTVKKLDNTTTAFIATLNDGTKPTGSSRD